MTKSKVNTEEKIEPIAIKKQSLLMKVIVGLTIILFSFLGFKYWVVSEKDKVKAEHSAGDQNEVFDIDSEGQNKDANSQTRPKKFTDLTAVELREGGIELVYQLLLKNQVQIEDLNLATKQLQADLNKYRNQDKIGKIILLYVDIREKVEHAQKWNESMANVELLAAGDQLLTTKLQKFKSEASEFPGHDALVKEFQALIPEIIATKTYNPDDSFIAKIRHSLSKLIVVRRIDGHGSSDVDTIISQTENHLADSEYAEALQLLITLDPSFHNILDNFLTKLNNASELKKSDQEIMNYLKSVS